MIYRLIIITGPLKGQRVTIDPEPMTIGRDPESTLVLPDDEAALKHAVIEHRDDGLFIRDLGSMHKIIVNKREVSSARIKHGDTLEIGRTRFLVQAVVKAEVNPPPPTVLEELPPRRSPLPLAAAALLLL
ncbi:MAG TPA: FHA domain-containing protein, partial [Kiritimatiellia bacterium]|nr:FHA domain-containing protein [Kiritimatiellia bacterium]